MSTRGGGGNRRLPETSVLTTPYRYTNMGAVLRALGIFLLWSTGMGICLAIPVALAVPAAAALCAAFLWRYVLRAGQQKRGSAALGLRPLGTALPWLLLAGPVFFLFGDSLAQVYSELSFVDRPPRNPIDAYTRSVAGWILMLLIAAVFAPLLEEFTFRGWVQGSLERRHGTGVAIGAGALLFALTHFDPLWLPVYALAGTLLGVAVAVTRSVWAGVILHAMYNGGVLLVKMINLAVGRSLGAGVDFGAVPPVLVLVASIAALLLLGARIHRMARHGTRRRSRNAPVHRRTARDPSLLSLTRPTAR